MSPLRAKSKIAILAALIAVAAAWLFIRYGGALPNAAEPKAHAAQSGSAAGQSPAPAVKPTVQPAAAKQAPRAEVPDESAFRPAAESPALRLWVDPSTAHFKVEHKESGRVWRSYSNPEYWSKETITGTWRNNIRSPIMLEYVNLANAKAQPKIISWLEDNGALENFQTTADGFKVTFSFTGTQFKIPVEVRLKDDYVETKIIDSGIQEGSLSLLNVKLYPLFGAEPSAGQEGYLLVPDGSGALIRFKENRTNDKSIYYENIYGNDVAFYSDRSSRNAAKMPVFGIKSGNQAMVAVIDGGEEYAKLFASPAGAFGQSNWVTPEWQYRSRFFQNTSKTRATGFFTYNKERFSVPERKVRYYLLEEDKSDYAGMAAKYREFLTKEKGLKPLTASAGTVPFFLNIIGADVKKGLLRDQYLNATSTSEAVDMVKRLYELGIENMTIQYSGWQNGGYSSYGGLFPVDKRLGGNGGMKRFVEFAHSLKLPVYLTANYTINNNGGDGFRPRYEGLRNLAGKLLEYENFNNREMITLTSPKFAAKVIAQDMRDYQSLGVDGIYFEEGIGRYLNSDFNDRYPATRSAALETQRQILRQTQEALGGAGAESANGYAWDQVKFIHRLPDDYSYELFIDESVPFAQIALHGIIAYTSDWSNLRDQFRSEFLRSIEYGAYPAYVFTSASSGDLKGAYSIWYYSTDYRDWETQALEEYKRFNQALGDVQDKAIIGHRTLAPNVKETVYEGGKRIIVNYNSEEYDASGVRVPAQDFIVDSRGIAR